MVVDTSVVLAILQEEPESTRFAELIEGAEVCLISAVSVLEAGVLAESRKGPEGSSALDELVREARFRVVSFDADQASLARLAWRRFGKGPHPAGLNFGDCAVYALAKSSGETLLFKGDDFMQTDIAPFSRLFPARLA